MSVISLVAVLTLAPAPTFNQLADRCIRVHKAASQGAFAVTFSSTGTDNNRSGTYEVAYRRPDRLRFRARMVPTSKVGPVDQTFMLLGPAFYGIDHNAASMLQRKAVASGTLTERFQSALTLDEPIRIAADAVGLELFLSPMRELTGWKITERGDRQEAIALTPTGRFEVVFSKSSGRLTSVAIRSGAAGLRWAYSNWKSNPGSFNAPTGLRKVTEFFEPPPLPTAADNPTRDLLAATFGAYGRLRHVAYRVLDGDQATNVWVSDGAARQVTARGEWMWKAGNLRLAPKGTGAQTVKAKLADAETRVTQMGMAPEPMLKRFLRGQNPLHAMWKSDLKARIAGQVNVGQMQGTILELTAQGIRITAIIDRRTSLIQSLTTDSLDRAGKVVTSSERRFTYVSVGKPLPTLGR